MKIQLILLSKLSSEINILALSHPVCSDPNNTWIKKKKEKKKRWSCEKDNCISLYWGGHCSSFQKHAALLKLSQQGHWLALQPYCLASPLTANLPQLIYSASQNGKEYFLPVLLTLEQTGEMQCVCKWKPLFFTGFLPLNRGYELATSSPLLHKPSCPHLKSASNKHLNG